MQRRNVKFTVDAALLRELGARLVGKPQIALAELIKNSYDADARHVRIEFTPDQILVEDDGHGMSADTFAKFWMRVGTTHKANEKVTPELKRRLTGSKGVGRLAAQLLGSDLRIESVALLNPRLKGYEKRIKARSNQLHPMLGAHVDWDSAVEQNELTRVTVPIVEGGDCQTFANGSRVGTRLVITELASDWDEDDFRALAREIWALQPPFDVDEDDEQAFAIELVSDYGDVTDEFRDQMQSIFDTWQAQVELSLEDDDQRKEVLFEFDALKDYDDDEDGAADDEADTDETPNGSDATPRNLSRRTKHRDIGATKLLRVDITLRAPTASTSRQYVRIPNCPIDAMASEILVFNLRNRQAHGISVSTAREYMRTFGGVHIYDDSFRLPYYGPEDWLNIERDHARRLSRSQLVPSSLAVAKGLHDLPSRRRLFGTTTISTAREKQTAGERHMRESDALAIQVSRDRLADNLAFTGLRNLVRLGLDLYATEVARSKGAAVVGKRRDAQPPVRATQDLLAVREAVAAAKDQFSTQQYQSITDYLSDAEKNVRTVEDTADAQASLFGTLATVGMTTLAWEHEATKQRLVVLDAARALRTAATGGDGDLAEVVAEQSERLVEAAQRMNDVARLFRPVLDRESRETRAALQVRKFIQRTAKHLSVLSRGAEVSAKDVPRDLIFPPGSFSGWSAIFQNLLVNAFNAVLESDVRDVRIDGGTTPNTGWVRIQDTGIGVDLAEAESYFLPFVRGLADDPRRAELGLGGSGLGLTIVRMIADTMGVTVRFVAPEPEYATAVILEWRIDK